MKRKELEEIIEHLEAIRDIIVDTGHEQTAIALAHNELWLAVVEEMKKNLLQEYLEKRGIIHDSPGK